MNIDETYMQRCIQIAKNGSSSARPNPSVGAVIVYENSIIGEGFTSPYGGNHAEVNAINSVSDKSLLSKATLYVSLEPCSHFGKTPPCCDLVVLHKIPHVVIGALDPNPKVAGMGISRIKHSGAKVVVGILEKECIASNKHFFTFHIKKRPFIILKWAQSADGFIAPKTKSEQNPVWISNEISQQLSHKIRSEAQAILVGTTTVLDDNPTLTTRNWSGKNPTRIVIDKEYKLSKSLHIFDNQAETIIIGKNEIDFDANIALQISDFLYQKNIQSLMVEGGSQTLQTFINANCWDEAYVFDAEILLHDGTKSPTFKKAFDQQKGILNNNLYIYHNYD